MPQKQSAGKGDLKRLEQEEEQRNVNRLERKGGVGKTLTAAPEKTGSEKARGRGEGS